MALSKVGLVTHHNIEDVNLLHKLYKTLSQEYTVYIEPATAKKIKKKGTPLSRMNVDLLVVLGGDGTLLWSISKVKNNPLILGVNTGRVGYLTELTTKNLFTGLEKIVEGRYWIDERAKLKANNRHEALNEILILPQKPATLLEFKLHMNNQPINRFRADGIMVSTQTGSTGYALSLGGPIIHPDTPAHVVVPMNPFMKEHGPLVIPDNSRIRVELLRRNHKTNLIADGKVVDELNPGDTVEFSKSENTVRFIRFNKRARDHHIAYIRAREK